MEHQTPHNNPENNHESTVQRKVLHQNSGKWSWEKRIGRFFIGITIAEDPSEKWWNRRWEEYDKQGLLTTNVFTIQRKIQQKPDQEDITAWFIYFFMVQLFFAKI